MVWNSWSIVAPLTNYGLALLTDYGQENQIIIDPAAQIWSGPPDRFLLTNYGLVLLTNYGQQDQLIISPPDQVWSGPPDQLWSS